MCQLGAGYLDAALPILVKVVKVVNLLPSGRDLCNCRAWPFELRPTYMSYTQKAMLTAKCKHAM